jgi:hypothetical protein
MSFMILLVTIMTSSAVVASSLMARYTICLKALFIDMSWTLHGNRKRIETYILVLEEFCCPKEQRCGLLRAEGLPNVKQIDNASQEGPAFPGANWRVVENTGFLNNRCLVIIVRTKATLVLLFRGVSHC